MLAREAAAEKTASAWVDSWFPGHRPFLLPPRCPLRCQSPTLSPRQFPALPLLHPYCRYQYPYLPHPMKTMPKGKEL